MSQYNNLPGVYVNKQDGNLAALENAPGNVVLIIGTAPAGPINKVYLVKDPSTAFNLFDPNKTRQGTLIKSMYEALEGAGGAASSVSIALYRICANNDALDFNGWHIEAADLSLYQAVYSFVSATGVHALKVYETSTGALQYSSVTGLDTGLVTVIFDSTKVSALANITIGDVTAGTEKVTIKNITSLFTNFIYGTGAGTIAATTTSYSINGVAAAVQNALHITTIGNGAASLIVPGSIVKVDAKYYVVRFTSATDTALKTVIVFSHELAYDNTTGWTLTALGATTITTGSVTAWIACGKLQLSRDGVSTGQTASKGQLYTELARAYRSLETAAMDEVVVPDITVDALNSGLDLATNFAYNFEYNGEIFCSFKDTSTGSAVYTVPSPAEVGVDSASAAKLLAATNTIEGVLAGTTVAATFSPVDFAHQFATFLHGLSVNDNEANGFIATSSAINFAKASVSNWIGKLPARNATTGLVGTIGSGLLGNKFLVGGKEATSTEFLPGYFLTSTGFYDGTALKDANGVAIDLGKYLSVIPTPVRIITDFYGSSLPYYSSTGAAAYLAGFYASFSDPRVAPTHKPLNGRVALAINLSKSQLDVLTAVGYVTFGQNASGSAICVDSPTAALAGSDWKRYLTVKLAGTVIELARRVADPFIGGLNNGNVRLSLEEQQNALMVDLQKRGYILSGSVQIRADRAMEIAGNAVMKVSISLPGELRRITMYVALSK